MPMVEREAITAYWDERAWSYYNGVSGELGDERRTMWEDALADHVGELVESARDEGRPLRILDLGCGPGFFSVIFAGWDCQVDAIDTSAEMLDRASFNLCSRFLEDRATLHHGDITELPFPDGTFDLAISRNVTWLMREPEETYAEWLRVLKPGGKMLAFDANWYRYLVDPEIAAARDADQESNVLEGWDEESQATSDEEKRCEEMAATLPLTPVLRPEWDHEALSRLGATDVKVDKDIWKRVWPESEQIYYASSPMFLVEAVK